jgi:hypothetical protein
MRAGALLSLFYTSIWIFWCPAKNFPAEGEVIGSLQADPDGLRPRGLFLRARVSQATLDFRPRTVTVPVYMTGCPSVRARRVCAETLLQTWHEGRNVVRYVDERYVWD